MHDAATDPETAAVKEMAHFILAFIEGHSVGYLAAIHAATIVITSMAMEDPEPIKTLEDLLADIRGEAHAMIQLIAERRVHDA